MNEREEKTCAGGAGKGTSFSICHLTSFDISHLSLQTGRPGREPDDGGRNLTIGLVGLRTVGVRGGSGTDKSTPTAFASCQPRVPTLGLRKTIGPLTLKVLANGPSGYREFLQSSESYHRLFIPG